MSFRDEFDEEPFYDCPTSNTMAKYYQRLKIYLPKDKTSKRMALLIDRVHKKDPKLSVQVAWIFINVAEAYLIQKYVNMAILLVGGL